MKKADRDDIDYLIHEFQKIITEWWQKNKRSFPWRERADLFGTLVAELLLRKTTATQVSTVYLALLERWSDPCSLSQADEGEIQAVIKPLGMQKTRATLLKRLGQALCKKFGPNPNPTPLTVEDLDGLPGVGLYARNMVLAVAEGLPLPGLDRNFIRVIERFFGLKSLKKRPHTDPLLWQFAERLMPKQKSGEFNWAVLDFASLLCKPKPHCTGCPLRHLCRSQKR